ncbi:MAG TPA: nucleoside-diphosphate sugar epimerase/dehydratase [Kofleriaceae bacterium]|nr:nucleoside-diphosphate sugar epimerase/dehydratase [Kofleriaceae bacterium]
MPRFLTRGLQIAVDLGVLSAAFWLAFLIRFEFSIPSYWLQIASISWPFVLGLEYGALVVFGVPKYAWRYISFKEAATVVLAMTVASSLLLIPRLLDGIALEFLFLPLGVLCANLVLAIGALVGVRATRRGYVEARDKKRRGKDRHKKRVLLIGAGEAGVMVAREIARRPDLGLQAVGFLDDDKLKVGANIGGLPVLGTTAQLVEVAQRKRIARVLITIANAGGSEIRRIAMACKEANLDTKIIPGIYEIVDDRVNLSRIREVAIEDLLGREPVQLDEVSINHSIRNEIVVVTGAGGSIGSELCRQVCRFAPKRLVLVERFENALFEIHRELRKEHPTLAIEPCIADVTDAKRMDQVFAEHRPNVVFHAAAHKHVPMMEANPGEAVKNNVGGTRVLATLADKYEVDRFVLVSTDKAVNPTSVMGATKRVAEIYTQALGQRSKTRFVTVRFGNVLGSNGSVIPIFKEQIARGGPVTVTHPEMKRYFMTIPEASQLVLQAGAMGEGSEIFILDMGEPVKIVDLARDLIRLSGLRPDEDIAIEFAGIRPGEKLFEELSTDTEHASKTKHPKIFIGRIAPVGWAEASRSVDELIASVELDGDRIRHALHALVPEYTGAPELPRETKPRRVEATTGSQLVVGA